MCFTESIQYLIITNTYNAMLQCFGIQLSYFQIIYKKKFFVEEKRNMKISKNVYLFMFCLLIV